MLSSDSSLTFKGNFVVDRLKGKQASYLKSLSKTCVDGMTNESIIKKFPFDVMVYCHNKSKKAIHPRYTYYIESKQNDARCFGFIHINSKNNLIENIKKIRDFISNFDVKSKKILENRDICPQKENIRIAELLVSNYFCKNPFNKW